VLFASKRDLVGSFEVDGNKLKTVLKCCTRGSVAGKSMIANTCAVGELVFVKWSR